MTLVDISGKENKKNILETKLKCLKQAVATRILGMRVKTERDSGRLNNLKLIRQRMRREVRWQITTNFGTRGKIICASC
jgi:hypothetical protein